jgi:hypothetical protein
MFEIYVNPILEFGCPIFNPYYFKDIDSMKKSNENIYDQFIKDFKLELRRLKICFINI